MTKTIVKSIIYVNADTVEFEGTEQEVQKFLKKGYKIHSEQNGFLVLVKPAKINVTLSKGVLTKNFDMSEEVLAFYSRKKTNPKLVERFKQDINTGKLKLVLESEDEYSFSLKRA